MTQKERKEVFKLLPQEEMTPRFVELYHSCKLLGEQRLLLMFFCSRGGIASVVHASGKPML
jgi:hypothetical protein